MFNFFCLAFYVSKFSFINIERERERERFKKEDQLIVK